MTWTTPTDRATGFLVTAAIYNTELVDNLAHLHGDAGNVDLTAGNAWYGMVQARFGPNTAGLDTYLTRNGNAGQLSLVGTGLTGQGNLIPGALSTSGGPTTWTPSASIFLNRYNMTGTGTLTIAAPSVPPGANQAALMIILIQNASGGAITLSWNAAYAGTLIAGPAAGSGSFQILVWDYSISKWLGIQTGTTATGV